MKKMRLSLFFLFTVFLLGFYIIPIEAQNQFDQIGTFESNLPAYWTIGNEPTGSTLTWATDQFISMGHSLKIDKSTATTDSAAWVSDNMCDIWSPNIPANVDILFGAWIKTENVNTNPTSNDEKWYLNYAFYDSAGALIGNVQLPIDQSTATSSGWMADTTAVGQISLPKAAWKLIISFVGGKNATGTVWADNFIFTGRGGQWAGQDWNTQLGVPTGMYYWLPPNGGNDGLINDGFENTVVTTEAAHSGTHSLKFDMPAGRQVHDGFVSTIRMPFSKIDPTIKPGDVLRIAVWIKGDSLQPDSAAKYPSTWAVGLTPGFFSTVDNNAGYNPVGQQSDYQWVFPHATSFDWTQYYLDVQVPDTSLAKALEVRLHVYSTFTGIVYFDDLTVTKIEVPALSDVGSFEQTLPSFWTMGEQPSTLSWATDQFLSMGHSLKIEKTTVGDSASWISQNMCDIWSPTIPANVDILFGAWIKTENVNTNPTTDDEKWYLNYSFYDSAGALIGAVKLPIDQSVGTSTGWVADTTGVGQVSLPKAAWKLIISFVGGKNATGTVWADNFIFTGRGGQWAGQDWNTSVGVPTGWYYWFPPIGGNDGVLSNGFENTVVTDSTSHSGLYSLEFNMPITRQVHDGFVGSMRYLLDGSDFTMGKVSTNVQQDIAHLSNILPGDSIRISVWIKASGLYPDSAAKYPSTWAVGLTPGFFSTNNNNAGYNPLPNSQNDYQFTFPTATSFDWTKFDLDIQVPDTSLAKAIEVRLHVYSTFAGKVFFDDLTIQKISSVTSVNMNHLVPASFLVYQNYPNPFNPSTMISYFLPNASKVKIVIYDMLGREVTTLVNNFQNSGTHEVVWNGDNNFGEKVASGAYIYRVVAGNNIATKKMILLK